MERKLYKNSEENHHKIVLALTEIASEKPFYEISVTEVCKKACVSKNTFYRHFTNLSDIVYQQVDKITEELFAELADVKPSDFYTIYLKACIMWQKRKDFMCLFLQDEVSYIIKNRIRRITEDLYGFNKNINSEDFFLEYLVGINMTLLEWWSKRNFEDPPEKVASYIMDCLSGKPLKQMQERL